jgi:hypothetical protein
MEKKRKAWQTQGGTASLREIVRYDLLPPSQSFNGPNPNTKLTKFNIDESYPMGWPQLAAFLNSAENHAIFRRFGTEHCCILLHLMAEITSIQKELDILDQADAENKDKLYRLRRNEWHEGWDTAQKDLLDKLRTKLLEYGKSDFL